MFEKCDLRIWNLIAIHYEKIPHETSLDLRGGLPNDLVFFYSDSNAASIFA